MKNYFCGSPETPHHISIGAILINKESKIACHYYEEPQIRKYPPNFYTLMHESIEPNETLEQTLTRGLMEEFSMMSEIKRFVGSLIVKIKSKDVPMEKTVLYFLCEVTNILERNTSDPEAVSEIKWMDIEELISIMKKQGELYGAGSDESKILEDVKKYYLEQDSVTSH